MMSFYYVKNGGTATGDAGRYASQQSGSFAGLGASGYYDSIELAISATTPPVSGDFINASDLHSFTDAASISYTGLTVGLFYIVSVDDANVDANRTVGNLAFEQTTGSASDINFNNDLFISGFDFLVNDNAHFNGGGQLIIADSRLTLPGTNDMIAISGDGAYLKLENCELAFNSPSARISINSGNLVTMFGGMVTTTTGGLIQLIDSDSGGVGGCHGDFKGVDLSAVTGTILNGIGGSRAGDDNINFIFDMCKLATGVSFTNEDFKSFYQRALFTRCSDSSAAAEYQYHLHAFGGDVDDDSGIFRNEDEPFTESNQKISYKIVTNSDASLGAPLWFDFPIKDYAVLSAGATDTLRFYINSAVALTNKDIYIEVSYPDGTNKQTPSLLSSAQVTVGGTLDLMATGTTLTTDGVSSWTGALANLYQIDLDTSGNVGSDTVPIVRVYITKPSATIQMASEFGQV